MGELGFSVTHEILQFGDLKIVSVLLFVSSHISLASQLADFCRGSRHVLTLDCPGIPLKANAIAVPTFSKKTTRTHLKFYSHIRLVKATKPIKTCCMEDITKI